MRTLLRGAVIRALSDPALARCSLGRVGPRVVVFMLHRFRNPDLPQGGHDPKGLWRTLALLRRARVPVLALDDYVAGLRGDRGPDWNHARTAVVFTVDDGYEDCMAVGLPVFREFDIPVTVFVVPGIIEAASWLWWDKVEWLLSRQQSQRLVLDGRDEPLPLEWRSVSEREIVTQRIIEHLKGQPPAQRDAVIAQLAESAWEPMGRTPPLEYRVADWDTLRRAESDLVRFGPHTMTHPILSACSDAESHAEILRSVERLHQELRQPSRVFCYPNGTDRDFGAREEAYAREAGTLGAVSTIPGFVRAARLGHRDRLLWRLPRVSFSDAAGENLLAMLRVE